MQSAQNVSSLDRLLPISFTGDVMVDKDGVGGKFAGEMASLVFEYVGYDDLGTFAT